MGPRSDGDPVNSVALVLQPDAECAPADGARIDELTALPDESWSSMVVRENRLRLARAEWKGSTSCLYGARSSPIRIPATKTARNPERCASVVTPNRISALARARSAGRALRPEGARHA